MRHYRHTNLFSSVTTSWALSLTVLCFTMADTTKGAKNGARFSDTLRSGFRIDCDPTEASYQGMACASEMNSILHVREEALWPVNPQDDTVIHFAQEQPYHNCTECWKSLAEFDPLQNVWRTPFRFESSATEVVTYLGYLMYNLFVAGVVIALVYSIVLLRFRRRSSFFKSPKFWIVGLFIACYFSIAGNVGHMRSAQLADFTIDSMDSTATALPVPNIPRKQAAVDLLLYAHTRRKSSFWDALAAATVSRRLLHAGQPKAWLSGKAWLSLPSYKRLLQISGSRSRPNSTNISVSQL